MSPDMSSAQQRAAAAFNDVASAAKIAIEALAKIAAEPGRAIEIVRRAISLNAADDSVSWFMAATAGPRLAFILSAAVAVPGPFVLGPLERVRSLNSA